jgi:putative colanic acid biosynthesis acetyltransferase WcaF
MSFIHLDRYTPGEYSPGASIWKQLLWFFLGDPLLRSSLFPISGFKVWMLRSFGASIGQGVRIKPGVKVKFPWRLTIGDHCWIGENVWFDNLAPIVLEDHICVSQSVYFCTGNHDWTVSTFDLRVAPIIVKSGAWLAARSTIAPGVEISEGAVLSLGSVAVKSLSPWTIYAGNPAVAIKPRTIKDQRFSPEFLNA